MGVLFLFDASLWGPERVDLLVCCWDVDYRELPLLPCRLFSVVGGSGSGWILDRKKIRDVRTLPSDVMHHRVNMQFRLFRRVFYRSACSHVCLRVGEIIGVFRGVQESTSHEDSQPKARCVT